ncbi:MAG: amidohydrolase family protein, partial [Acidimicrobiales bacterium]
MARSLLIEAAWIVPVDPQFNIIKNGAILIRDDKILEVGRIGEISADGAEVRSFPHHVVIPGLVNAHTHVVGAVFRGLLEDRRDGFYGFALPMEQFLDADASYALSRLGIGELQLAGCTAMNDMFHYSEETLRAAQDAGIRAQVAHKVFDTDLTKLDTGRHITDKSLGLRRLQENIDLYQVWNAKAEG